MLSIFFFYGGMGILALRIALALIFLVHGWQKIKNLKQTATAFDRMGFKPGFFWGTIVALLEFVGGGIGLLLGIFTPTIAALLALQFVAIVVWKLAKKQPFVSGWEFDLLILAALLVLALNGAGAYSLDRLFLFGL